MGMLVVVEVEGEVEGEVEVDEIVGVGEGR